MIEKGPKTLINRKDSNYTEQYAIGVSALSRVKPAAHGEENA